MNIHKDIRETKSRFNTIYDEAENGSYPGLDDEESRVLGEDLDNLNIKPIPPVKTFITRQTGFNDEGIHVNTIMEEVSFEHIRQMYSEKHVQVCLSILRNCKLLDEENDLIRISGNFTLNKADVEELIDRVPDFLSDSPMFYEDSYIVGSVAQSVLYKLWVEKSDLDILTSRLKLWWSGIKDIKNEDRTYVSFDYKREGFSCDLILMKSQTMVEWFNGLTLTSNKVVYQNGYFFLTLDALASLVLVLPVVSCERDKENDNKVKSKFKVRAPHLDYKRRLAIFHLFNYYPKIYEGAPEGIMDRFISHLNDAKRNNQEMFFEPKEKEVNRP